MKRIIAIFFIILITVSCVGCSKKRVIISSDTNNKQINKQITTEINNTQTVKYKILAPDGAEKEIIMDITGGEGHKQVANKIIETYKGEEYYNVLLFPKQAKIKSMTIYNETLTIDFSQEISSIKFTDTEYEKKFIDTLVYSLLQSSSTQKFEDVAFTIEGKRSSHVFGNIDTNNPITVK